MISRPSPNRSPRDGPIRLIVCHADASPVESATISWILNPKSEVSYHVLIARDGTMYRFVEDKDKAWADGYSAWRGVRGVNGISLNVAVANRQDGKEPITPQQFTMLRAYIQEMKMKYPSIEAVSTHKRVVRWKNGKRLNADGKLRKYDPEAAPNWTLDIEAMLGVSD